MTNVLRLKHLTLDLSQIKHVDLDHLVKSSGTILIPSSVKSTLAILMHKPTNCYRKCKICKLNRTKQNKKNNNNIIIYLPCDPNPKVLGESSFIDSDSFLHQLHDFQNRPLMSLLSLFYILTFYTNGIAFSLTLCKSI